jgi:hypothetical protein
LAVVAVLGLLNLVVAAAGGRSVLVAIGAGLVALPVVGFVLLDGFYRRRVEMALRSNRELAAHTSE